MIKDVTWWIALEKNPVTLSCCLVEFVEFRDLLILRSNEDLITKLFLKGAYLSKMAHVPWSD